MYFDIQVNGAYGIDFNDDQLSPEAFRSVSERLYHSGVRRFFPTIITAPIDTICNRVHRLANWIAGDSWLGEMVRGIHVEGPFISPKAGYRGTHPDNAIQSASLDTTKRIADAGQGLVRLVTLAPEVDESCQSIDWLSRSGIVVFAGHTDASLDCLKRALDHGLKGFTHLGNGCAMEVHRHDNIVNRVLALKEKLTVSVIADGVHIPFWLLRSWVEILGAEHMIVTSDAMSAAGMPPGEYLISGQPIVVDSDRRTHHRDHHYLAGSASLISDMDAIAASWLSGFEGQRRQLFFDTAANLFDAV